MDDFVIMEIQLDVRNESSVYAMRLGWKNGRSLPKQGEFISLHLPASKALMNVTRIGKTCMCCPQAMTFVHIESVDGVMQQDAICECARKKPQCFAAGWRDIASEVACLKKNRSILRDVSNAIKDRKSSQ